uniref:Vesicle transport through interaction with t-SNAREs 1B n=1 Tax=Scleropages formosus TaxID=113540 RepID=A0A8C9R8Y5_SCLFO
MPQEEFEKLHEMFQSLHEEMKRMLQRAPLCYGEEKKRLMKDFSGRYREAEEMTQLQSQRVLLLLGTESLHHATQSIKRSQHIAAESEHIGSDIVEELGEQREQLDRTRDRVRDTCGNNGRIADIFTLMTNKMLLSLIILMEIGILGAVVYLKFFHK